MKILIGLFLIAILYVGIGVVARIVHCKNTDKQFKLDRDSIEYMLLWPKNL